MKRYEKFAVGGLLLCVLGIVAESCFHAGYAVTLPFTSLGAIFVLYGLKLQKRAKLERDTPTSSNERRPMSSQRLLIMLAALAAGSFLGFVLRHRVPHLTDQMAAFSSAASFIVGAIIVCRAYSLSRRNDRE